MNTIWQDLRYGVRMLVKNPGFTVVAVLTLALGIGANTAIFSLIDAVLLRMLPVNAPEQLVLINTVNEEGQPRGISHPMFRDLQTRSQVFAGIFCSSTVPLRWSTGGETEQVVGELVSGNYFSILGVNSFLGRVFSNADDNTPGVHPVAVISDTFWQRRFGGDPAVIGKTITLNEQSCTVVGIAPPGFYGTEVGVSPDVRIPLMMEPQVKVNSLLNSRSATWFRTMARLKPGVSEKQAQAATQVLFRQLAQEEVMGNPKLRSHLTQRIVLQPGSQGLSSLRRQFKQPLLLLAAVVGFVLLIACANVANLFLTRATARQKEIAVRLALGSSRFRLVRQLLTESVLLCALGGLAGLVVAFWSVDLLLSFLPRSGMAVVLEIRPDARILGFTLAVSVITGMLFGLVPSIQATRPDLMPVLRNESSVLASRSHHWELRKALMVSQVALSLVLLIGAGLFVRTLQNLQGLDAGFKRENVLVLSLTPAQGGYTPTQLKDFYIELLQRVEALPGVRSASYVGLGLLSGSSEDQNIYPAGNAVQSEEESYSVAEYVGPKFFETMGTSILRGRDFSPQDNDTAPNVAIINDAYARYFFPEENPIGKRIGIGGKPEMEIIGVVQGAKYHNLREAIPRTVYRPIMQSPHWTRSTGRRLYIRTTVAPTAILNAVRLQARSFGKILPWFNVRLFTELVEESLAQERLISLLSGCFGVLALVVTVIGLHGVVAYNVLRRTREIGVRMALGAQPRDVLKLVVGQVMVLTIIGIGIGLAVAFAVTRLLTSLLYGVSTTDPVTFVGITVLMAMVALLACYLPARRATRVDPMVALRYE